MDGPACGTCKHWHKNPADPMQLGAPPQGQCRGGPPVPIGIPTPQGLQIAVMYPTIPREFPACGAHVPRPAIIEG